MAQSFMWVMSLNWCKSTFHSVTTHLPDVISKCKQLLPIVTPSMHEVSASYCDVNWPIVHIWFLWMLFHHNGVYVSELRRIWCQFLQVSSKIIIFFKMDRTIYYGPPLYQDLHIELRIIDRSLATDSPCGFWGHGWTNYLLYDGPLLCLCFKWRFLLLSCHYSCFYELPTVCLLHCGWEFKNG